MKKLFLIFLFIVVSCYKPSNEFPYPEYLGHWINELTFINGKIDYDGKIPHISFGIMQSEVTLYDGTSQIKIYQNWKVYKADSIMWLKNTGDSISFKILVFPSLTNTYIKQMILANDSIIYQLKQ